MSRLADRLMSMDGQAHRPHEIGGLPALRPGRVSRGRWLLIAPLVIVVVMGIAGVAVMVRPQGTGLTAAPAPLPVLRPLPVAVRPVSPAPAAAPASVNDRYRALVREALEAARAQDLSQAAALFRQALDTEPAASEAWNQLGVVLTRQGEATKGMEAFRRALRLKPAYADAHRNLAVALDRQGRSHEAAQHYRSYLSHSAGSDSARADVSRRLAELAPARRSLE